MRCKFLQESFEEIGQDFPMLVDLKMVRISAAKRKSVIDKLSKRLYRLGKLRIFLPPTLPPMHSNKASCPVF